MKKRIILNSNPKGHKEYKYLYQKMLDKEVIRKAYKKLRKGKTSRKEIQNIDANLDEEVEMMRLMILNTKPPDVPVDRPELSYKPPKRTPKKIYEHGKWRKIYMPEIHEQWLHHIIILIVEPIITATSYPYSCGSFPGRGAHYAKKKIESWLKKDLKGTRYFGKIDIRHFYDSIKLDVLIKELSIRIKDSWFLYIIKICLSGFKKGIPLGFYISQWFANYLLEPVDHMILHDLGIEKMIRYMDDITFFGPNKKKLHAAIIEIKKLLGRRFRLKLKSNYAVCKFLYHKKDRAIGRPLDFMGFLFYREKTLIRKHIMLSTTRLARKICKAKEAGRRCYHKYAESLLSYIGWFSCSDTYDCYLKWIKPAVVIKSLKRIISKLKRRQNRERVEKGNVLGISGAASACCA